MLQCTFKNTWKPSLYEFEFQTFLNSCNFITVAYVLGFQNVQRFLEWLITHQNLWRSIYIYPKLAWLKDFIRIFKHSQIPPFTTKILFSTWIITHSRFKHLNAFKQNRLERLMGSKKKCPRTSRYMVDVR